MSVGLMMIVKNEAHILGRVAESLRGHIDYWTVVDTGSTDTTMQIAREVFGYCPGQLIQTEWRGFGPCRNVALTAAEPRTDWLLFIDADEELVGDLGAVVVNDEVDVVEAEEHSGTLRYWRPRLVRSGSGARWVGRTHEYLNCPSPRRDRTSTFFLEHHCDGGTRPEKFQRDIELLNEDFREDPNNPRTIFYLARTYDDLRNYAEAVGWYQRRLEKAGWEEEVFYARYRLGVCLLRLAKPDEGCGALWHAWGQHPERAEPLVALAEHYRQKNLWFLAWEAVSLAFEHCGARPGGSPTEDGLFVDVSAADWRAAYEGSIAAWYLGERKRGAELTDYLLDHRDLPPDIAASVVTNAVFYGASPDNTVGKT